MAASGAPERQPRRGPAPIASFDHDVSDESSPETKQAFRLPEIREDRSCVSGSVGGLAPPEQRARSHSTPAVAVAAALQTPAAPRIDISRASSSSHHDSRDSSPELALFAGGGGDEARARLELGFREDGALDLRSSTEELAFLEGAPGEPRAPPAAERRHSRKDSQGSEAALLAVSGRTSRLSSVGSQCSAHSALSGLSRASRLSVVSGVSRSPSPHRMLLETSFCGPRPIETDPEICAAAVEERLLEMAKLAAPPPPPVAVKVAVDARDRREVRTEATVESGSARESGGARVTSPAAPVNVVPTATSAPIAPVAPAAPPAPPAPPVVQPTAPVSPPTATAEPEKIRKETDNRALVEERRARPKLRREPSEPEVYKSRNRTKNVIRIKLRPDEDYGEEEEAKEAPPTDPERPPAVREPAPEPEPGTRASRPTELVGRAPASPLQQRRRPPRESRTPSPSGVPVSRKSSFCSLFKSRETIASPDSPSEALRRKRSLTEGRSRSKSRDRSATPTSSNKIRGSVLSLFRTPRKSATSPSPSSREGSPVVQQQRPLVPAAPPDRSRAGEKLKYYEDTRDGIIHIPLHTPPDERPGSARARRESDCERAAVTPVPAAGAAPACSTSVEAHNPPGSASAPAPRPAVESAVTRAAPKPIQRTVLPDGSIIIPLRSPTERVPDLEFPQSTTACDREQIASRLGSEPVATPPVENRVEADGAEASPIRERILQETTEVSHESVEAAHSSEDGRKRRKERLIFTTHVGSREQVFSTQFSITKTPSLTSEISGSFPAFGDGEETPTSVRNGGADTEEAGSAGSAGRTAGLGAAGVEVVGDASEAPRDSSESEPSSEAAAPRDGSEVERRGLVVQESFEEELPYVPTTLPLERPVALPMVPVRERGGVRVSALERPRAAPPPAPRPRAPAPPPPRAADADKLRIRLPRRPRPASSAPAARPSRPRTRSGGDGAESRPKEWIDFEEVPERRKQPKRIQTLPGGVAGVAGAAAAGAGGGVVFSYVEPEHCRCECHGHTRASSHHGAESPAEDAPLVAALADELDGAYDGPCP